MKTGPRRLTAHRWKKCSTVFPRSESTSVFPCSPLRTAASCPCGTAPFWRTQPSQNRQSEKRRGAHRLARSKKRRFPCRCGHGKASFFNFIVMCPANYQSIPPVFAPRSHCSAGVLCRISVRGRRFWTENRCWQTCSRQAYPLPKRQSPHKSRKSGRTPFAHSSFRPAGSG